MWLCDSPLSLSVRLALTAVFDVALEEVFEGLVGIRPSAQVSPAKDGGEPWEVQRFYLLRQVPGKTATMLVAVGLVFRLR